MASQSYIYIGARLFDSIPAFISTEDRSLPETQNSLFGCNEWVADTSLEGAVRIKETDAPEQLNRKSSDDNISLSSTA
jgi:hypothetical protein